MNTNEIELYIHIPFCVRKCDYCDFLSGVYNEGIQKRYAKALMTELRVMSSTFSDKVISSVYIGGGTPSWLNEDLMCEILGVVKKNYRLSRDCEVSIECNPGTMSQEKAAAYLEAGINRVSIGLQSANDDELYLLGRVHTFDRFLTTYESVLSAGFRDINVDVMTGLPYQTIDKLTNTLKEVTMLRPTHISAYSLIIEEGTKFYDRYKFDAVAQHAGMPTEYLPDDESNYNLYKFTQEYLAQKGYERYEISNYCKDGAKCRHNVGYWNRVPYLGVGIGAASLIDEHRTKNDTDIYAYIEMAEKIADDPEFIRVIRRERIAEYNDALGLLKHNNPELSESELESQVVCRYNPANTVFSPFWDEDVTLSRFDAMAEFMYLGLRQIEGVTREDFENMFHQRIDAVYGPVMVDLKDQGLLNATEGRIWLTDLGLDVSNQVLAKFLL